jgi:hypothetical protein
VPDRWRIFNRNLPDLMIVAVPMLRPLRVLRSVRLLRLLRLARLVALATMGISEARYILRRRRAELDAADRAGVEPGRRRPGADLRTRHAQQQHL